MTAYILRDGRSHRMDYVPAPASTADRVGAMAIRFAVGAPVVVASTVWGALIAGSSRPIPRSSKTELRLVDFADLVATAPANASTRTELNASRARVVAAADHARKLFERDLHDGAQQHDVSLGPETASHYVAAEALADTAKHARPLRSRCAPGSVTTSCI